MWKYTIQIIIFVAFISFHLNVQAAQTLSDEDVKKESFAIIEEAKNRSLDWVDRIRHLALNGTAKSLENIYKSVEEFQEQFNTFKDKYGSVACDTIGEKITSIALQTIARYQRCILVVIIITEGDLKSLFEEANTIIEDFQDDDIFRLNKKELIRRVARFNEKSHRFTLHRTEVGRCETRAAMHYFDDQISNIWKMYKQCIQSP